MLKRFSEAMSDIVGPSQPLGKRDAGDLFLSARRPSEKMHETFRVRQGDDIRAPNLIVPFDDDLDDFFATLAAYYAGYGPITAYSYVTSSEVAQRLLGEDGRTVWLDRAPKVARFACYGAAVGQATLVRWGSRTPDEPVDFATVRSMLSFALCRAHIVHGGSSDEALISQNWLKLQELAGHEVGDASVEVSMMVQSVAFSGGSRLAGPDHSSLLADSLERAVHGGMDAFDSVEEALSSLYPNLRNALDGLKGPFDARIDAFFSAIRTVMKGSRGPRIDDIAAGYICNGIHPGSFEHGAILKDLRQAFPIAIIWYGFFAACSLDKNSLSLQGSLFSKLDRDALEPFSLERRPRCDIAFRELDVLLRAAFRLQDILPSFSDSVIVSLADGVDIGISLVDLQGESGKSKGDAEQRLSRARSLLEEALRALSGEREKGNRPTAAGFIRRKPKS